MIYGYARVSTKGQLLHGNSLEQQEKTLIEHGAETVIKEQYTGSTTARPQLKALLDKLQPNDTLIATKLDRLARSLPEGISLIQRLLNSNVKVNVLNVGMLDNTPIGKFFISTLLAVAELERSMIAERMQAGKEIARTKEGYKEGRPRADKKRVAHALELIKQGKTYREVVELTGLSKATISRAVRAEKDKQQAIE